MTGPPASVSPLRALSALLLLLSPSASGHPPAARAPSNAPSAPTTISANNGTNPIDPGWYADPDAVRFGDAYWVYATISVAFGEQGAFDAFSAASPGSGAWTAHRGVFTAAPSSTSWARHSFWAPCAVERHGRYYLYYTANNPVEAAEPHSGIGVAVADHPAGPFVDLVDGPIVGDRIAGANPMDQMVFDDDDGQTYLIWGGSRALIVPLGDDMMTVGSWDDGVGGEQPGPRDITPNEGYGEGPYMLKRDGRYYFMWSEGGYGTPDYRVAYAVADAVTGPFERVGVILENDGKVADGPGHHSIVRDEEGEYWIVYHRRIIGDGVADHRVIAVDRFVFNDDGSIRPVVMT